MNVRISILASIINPVWQDLSAQMEQPSATDPGRTVGDVLRGEIMATLNEQCPALLITHDSNVKISTNVCRACGGTGDVVYPPIDPNGRAAVDVCPICMGTCEDLGVDSRVRLANAALSEVQIEGFDQGKF